MLKTFEKSEHNLFDSLVAFSVSFASLALSINTHAKRYSTGYSKEDEILFAGFPGVSNSTLSYTPRTLMDIIISDKWPTLIQYKVYELDSDQRPIGINIPKNELSSQQKVLGALAKPLFVDYYESNIYKIKSKYGDDSSNWPRIWNFGRIIRNAFSHSGEIFINNPDAQPVTWKNLSYSHSQNGRAVLFNNLGIADIVYLLEEMDEKILCAV